VFSVVYCLLMMWQTCLPGVVPQSLAQGQLLRCCLDSTDAAKKSLRSLLAYWLYCCGSISHWAAVG
jgi:hypothetical protein